MADDQIAHSTPRLCGHCRRVETVYDFCSGKCASAHYKAISELMDGTTINQLRARIAALEAESKSNTSGYEALFGKTSYRELADLIKAEKDQAVRDERGGWDLLIELRTMLKATGGDECQRGSSNDKLYKRIDKAIRARSQGEGEGKANG